MNIMSKRAILIWTFCLIPLVLYGQDGYFHDLRVVVDSSGVTHLAYIYNGSITSHCQFASGCDTLYSQVRYFNTRTLTDTSLTSVDTGPSDIHYNDVAPIGNNPPEYAVTGTYQMGFEGYGYFTILKSGVSMGSYFNIDDLITTAKYPNYVFGNFPLMDPSYDGIRTIGIPANTTQGALDTLMNMPEKLDSVKTSFKVVNDFWIFAFSPFRDHVVFGWKGIGGNLYKKDLQSGKIQVSDTESYKVEYSGPVYFDPDSAHIYRLADHNVSSDVDGTRTVIIRSDAFGELGSWEMLPGPAEFQYYSITADPTNSGGLYAYSDDKKSVFYSRDYGDTFEERYTFNNPVEGLFKSVTDGALYVLTKTRLLEIKDARRTILTKIPTDIAQKPVGIPGKTTLSQNYPNPFNPTTVISYQLSRPTHVKLSVYDIRGKLVQVLKNTMQQPGLHNLRINTGQMSSGVYIYQLKTVHTTLSKKMTLIK